MTNINDQNGASTLQLQIAEKLLNEFSGQLKAVEMGIAYGGGVEAIGKIWKGRGEVHGFDTFEGHPKELAYSQEAHEAYCMDLQYVWGGKEGLTYEYQRAELDRQRLSNVILHKGLVTEKSLDSMPGPIHYCLLDMDLITSMICGWLAVKDKIVKGGYLLLHDVVPRGHLVGLWGLYQEIMASGDYELISETNSAYLVILRRIR
jgi:hypothetical protein